MLTINCFALVVFWGSVLILLYAGIGYPALLWMLTRHRLQLPRPACIQKTDLPTVSIVIVARNAVSQIKARIDNLRQSVGLLEKPEIILVSDGTSDGMVDLIRKQGEADLELRLVELPDRSGKAAGLNAGIAAARGDIIVFGDVRQNFAPDAIARLAAHFADPHVGAVSGALKLRAADNPVGGGLEFYWEFEKKIRYLESQLDSSIGCTGAIYAVRRNLIKEPLPADTLLDDVVLPMRIALRGYRVLFDPAARAFDPLESNHDVERRRKARTMAGNIQLLMRYPRWLLPWHNRLWWQLLSHKYLRLLTPLLLLGLAVGSGLLVEYPFYALALACQTVFYLLAAIGLAKQQWRCRLVRWPAGFLFFSLLPLYGVWFYICRHRQSGWQAS